MSVSISRCVLITWLAALACEVAPAQGKPRGRTHEDPVNGFSIRFPADWKFVPVKASEKWIVGKYISNRRYTNKGKGYAFSLTPTMTIMAFSPEKLAGAKDDGGRQFRGYRDLVAKKMASTGLGFHYVEEEKETVRGAPVEKLRISAKRMGMPERAVVTWVFERPEDGSAIAVEFMFYEDRRRELTKEILPSLKSFKFMEKVAVSEDKESESPLWVRNRSEWRKLDLPVRIELRQRFEQERIERALASVPPGWFTMESRSGNYVAVSHADKAYTKRILHFAEVAREWLDRNIGDCSDEYVTKTVIRICKDGTEWSHYRSGSPGSYGSSYSSVDGEIVDYKAKGSGTSGGGYGMVASGLFSGYLYEKEPALSADLPHWLRYSLRKFIGDADVKGRKLINEPTAMEKKRMKNARKEGVRYSLEQIMTTPRHEWPEDRDDYWQYRYHCMRALRFLTEGPGKKHKLLKDFLPRYMRAAIAASAAAPKAEVPSEAMTVEEEEARKKERSSRKYWEGRYEFIIDRLNAEVCNFSAKEWASLNKKFASFLNKG